MSSVSMETLDGSHSLHTHGSTKKTPSKFFDMTMTTPFTPSARFPASPSSTTATTTDRQMEMLGNLLLKLLETGAKLDEDSASYLIQFIDENQNNNNVANNNSSEIEPRLMSPKSTSSMASFQSPYTKVEVDTSYATPNSVLNKILPNQPRTPRELSASSQLNEQFHKALLELEENRREIDALRRKLQAETFARQAMEEDFFVERKTLLTKLENHFKQLEQQSHETKKELDDVESSASASSNQPSISAIETISALHVLLEMKDKQIAQTKQAAEERTKLIVDRVKEIRITTEKTKAKHESRMKSLYNELVEKGTIAAETTSKHLSLLKEFETLLITLDNKTSELEKSKMEHDVAVDSFQNEIREKDHTIDELNSKINSLVTQVESLMQSLENKSTELDHVKEVNTKTIDGLQEKLSEKDKHLTESNSRNELLIQELESNIENLKKKAEELEKSKNEASHELEDIRESNRALENEILNLKSQNNILKKAQEELFRALRKRKGSWTDALLMIISLGLLLWLMVHLFMPLDAILCAQPLT